jgi:hypothetical protein
VNCSHAGARAGSLAFATGRNCPSQIPRKPGNSMMCRFRTHSITMPHGLSRDSLFNSVGIWRRAGHRTKRPEERPLCPVANRVGDVLDRPASPKKLFGPSYLLTSEVLRWRDSPEVLEPMDERPTRDPKLLGKLGNAWRCPISQAGAKVPLHRTDRDTLHSPTSPFAFLRHFRSPRKRTPFGRSTESERGPLRANASPVKCRSVG